MLSFILYTGITIAIFIFSGKVQCSISIDKLNILLIGIESSLLNSLSNLDGILKGPADFLKSIFFK